MLFYVLESVLVHFRAVFAARDTRQVENMFDIGDNTVTLIHGAIVAPII